MNVLTPARSDRAERRRLRTRLALVEAGHAVMAEKGIDAATMAEVAQRADVAAGTVYSYFGSKDELAVAVLEHLMHQLALDIERHTRGFPDPAQVFAYGVFTVIRTAATDPRWMQLLNRSEVMAEAMMRVMGPFAMADLHRATEAGRYHVTDAALTFRMTCHAIVGIALSISRGETPPDAAAEATAGILGMAGVSREDALTLVRAARG